MLTYSRNSLYVMVLQENIILSVWQAIDWIEELCDVMVRTHNNMGNTAQEAEALQEDNRKFEATAIVSNTCCPCKTC